MICPKCKKYNRDGAAFCAGCGSMLPAQTGTQNASSASGFDFGTPPGQTQPAPAEKKSGIGMLIAAIVLIIAGIWNIYDMNHTGSYLVFLGVIPAQYIAIPGGLLLLYLYFTEKK